MGRPHVLLFWVAVLVVLSCILDTSAEKQGNGKGKVKNLDAASMHYFLLPEMNNTAPECVLLSCEGPLLSEVPPVPHPVRSKEAAKEQEGQGLFHRLQQQMRDHMQA